jgi:uncharacterized repeat protein (TIGR02543 family)
VVSLTAHAADGYHFVGWSGDATGITNPVSVTMDAAKHVTATFAINTYALDVSVTGSGSVNKDPDQSVYDHGTLVTLTAVPALGFSFVGWSGDATGSANPTTVTMDAAKHVTATFAINMYSLNLTVVGSGTVAKDPDQASFSHGTVVTLTATPAVGYHFVGWSGDVSGSTNPTTVTMDAVKNVTATFALTTYVLDVSTAGSGTVTRNPDQPDYAPGTVVTLTAAPAAGNSFVGWSGAIAGYTNPQTVTMDGNKSVTAEFTLGGYTLAVTTSGDGTGSVTRNPNYALYAPGSVVTVTATAQYLSTFTGWSGDLTGAGSPQLLTMNGDKSVNAGFVANSYHLTTVADAAAGGSVGRLPDVDVYGPEVVTVTALPLPGWEFRGWCGDTTGADNPVGYPMRGDATIVGIFNEVGSPNVQVLSPNGGETVNVGSDVDIEWVASGPEGVSVVDVMLSRTGPSGSYETIATGVANTGSYTWNASGASSTNAFIRLVAHSAGSGPAGWDISDRRFELGGGALAVDEARVTELNLLPISPNPARGQVRLEFLLPTEANVNLSIIDITGRRVGTVASGTFGAGHHPMTWGGRGDQGRVAPGVYFLRLVAGNRTITRRFVYLQ